MGSIAATAKIKNIRNNLTEPILDSLLTDPAAGSNWTNTELLAALNKGKDAAWDLMRQSREDFFQIIGATLSLTTNTKVYDLATRFWQLTGIRVTTPGYEGISFRALSQMDEEYKDADAVPSGNSSGSGEMLYDIVAQGKIKFANYPPAALSVAYDYIETLADYTLAVDSTSSIPDVCAEFEEAYATRFALNKNAGDKRMAIWDAEMKRLSPLITKRVEKRNIRDSKHVESW